jgi:hypothetical protein
MNLWEFFWNFCDFRSIFCAFKQFLVFSEIVFALKINSKNLLSVWAEPEGPTHLRPPLAARQAHLGPTEPDWPHRPWPPWLRTAAAAPGRARLGLLGVHAYLRLRARAPAHLAPATSRRPARPTRRCLGPSRRARRRSMVRRLRRPPGQVEVAMRFTWTWCTSSAPHRRQSTTRTPPPPWAAAGASAFRRRPSSARPPRPLSAPSCSPWTPLCLPPPATAPRALNRRRRHPIRAAAFPCSRLCPQVEEEATFFAPSPLSNSKILFRFYVSW